MSTQKLYCYIDETGQDTKGQIFIVVVIILEEERKEIEDIILKYEKRSQKKDKWNKTNTERRIKFMEYIQSENALQNCVFWSSYSGTTEYWDLTGLSIAKAVLRRAKDPYQTFIMMDGANKKESMILGAILRKLHVRTKKIRGGDEKQSALLRLADACAGCFRDALEGDPWAKEVMEKMKKNKIEKQL